MTTVTEAAPVTTPVAQRTHLMGGAYDLSSAKSVDEALKLAGLDWEPTLVPVTAEFKGTKIDTGHHAVLNDKTGKSLGVVGKRFVPVGNRELAEFGQAVVDEADVDWAVGGSIEGGSLPFLQFKLPHQILVGGVDPVDTWFLATNGHGGNAAMTATITPSRLSCGNQVRSSRLKHANYRIRHSGNIDDKIVEAREVLGLSFRYMVEFEEIANQLADIDVDVTFFEDFVAELLPIDPDAGVRGTNSVNRQRATLRQNWKATETLDPDLKATGWGALNVVTEVIDHGNLAVRKSASQSAGERRFKEVHFGSGAKLRDRAFDLLTSELETPGLIQANAAERRLVLASAN
jgi:phage/plasmid-like protein (TIGR03299 family)